MLFVGVALAESDSIASHEKGATLYREGENLALAAQRLNQDLTPLGAERAGDQQGIPVWRGGLKMPPLGYRGPSHRRPNPFPNDATLHVIDHNNYRSFEPALSLGLQAILTRSNTRIHVYPTRRTGAAPDAVYDATYQNIFRVPGTSSLAVASGGIPYPIPTSGKQVLMNSLLRWQGGNYHSFDQLFQWDGVRFNQWPVATLAVFPFYQTEPREWGDQEHASLYQHRSRRHAAPASVVSHHQWVERTLDDAYQRQVSLTVANKPAYQVEAGDPVPHGVGRVSPNPIEMALTQLPPDLLFGQPESFHWQLVGKRALYIPYNNYPMFGEKPGYSSFLTPGMPDVSQIRFEKHRVWVLDGVVKSHKQSPFGKQVMYVDEDSWAPVMVERYAASGELVRLGLALLTSAYEVPAIVAEFRLELDIQNGRYWMYAPDDTIGMSRDYSYIPLGDALSPSRGGQVSPTLSSE